MSVSIKSLGLDELPIEDRISIIDQLWEGIIASNDAVPISDELAAELERRLSVYRSNPEDSHSPEQVRAAAHRHIGE